MPCVILALLYFSPSLSMNFLLSFARNSTFPDDKFGAALVGLKNNDIAL